MERDLLLFVLGQIVTGAAIWGAIRADIRNIMIRMNDIKEDINGAKADVGRAHKRIDDFLNGGHDHSRDSNGRS